MKQCKNCVHMHIHPITIKGQKIFYQCVANKHTALVLPDFECSNNKFKKKPEQLTLFTWEQKLIKTIKKMIMKTTTKKTVVKFYQGRTYVFVPENGRGYKVSAIGYSTYWYQSRPSLREAARRMDF